MSLTQFYLTVTNETAQFAGPADLVLTSGCTGTYEVSVSADSHWDGLALEAVFLAAPASWPTMQSCDLIRRSMPLEDGKAQVPEAILSKAGYILYVGLSGMADGIEKNSTLALVRRIQTGADPDGPGTEDIPETRYAELLREIEALKVGSSGSSSDGTAAAIEEPTADDIPKVFFSSSLPQTKTDTVMSLRYISKTMDVSGYCIVKAQGNTSMNYPKKNQTVKLYKNADCTEKLKIDFKGWGSQAKHCYKANWIDLSHARNIVSARLWADVVKSRSNYLQLPELLRTSPNQGAMDGFPIKVYAGGVYQGRYTLNIPKDKWAFNMDDSLETHCILCSENYVSGCFRADAAINGSDWTDEIHDTVPDSIKLRWNDVIGFVRTSTDAEFSANLGNYFDVDSLIDYHLFGLMSCGLDAYGKNQLYVTYDGQRWIASMYDMDSTWGLYWNGSKFVASDYGREEYEDMISGREGNLLYMRLEEQFHEALQNRWQELKSGPLSIENIINQFERFTDISPADLIIEDYADTTASGAYTAIPSQSTNNIQQIRAFALARRAWCDEYIADLTPAEEIACTGIALDQTELTVDVSTLTDTVTIHATITPADTTDTVVWSSSDESVITVKSGTLTFVGNGTATITATCGDYSATCSVTVTGIGDILYQLAAATTFDGVDDYINTGVMLFDRAKDFTILCNATIPSHVSGTTLFYCIKEVSPYPGLDSTCKGGYYQLSVSTKIVHYTATNHRYALRYTGGIPTDARVNGDGTIYSVNGLSGATFVQIDKPLILGARLNDDCVTYDRFNNATIHDFTVYNRVLTDDEVATYLNS